MEVESIVLPRITVHENPVFSGIPFQNNSGFHFSLTEESPMPHSGSPIMAIVKRETPLEY